MAYQTIEAVEGRRRIARIVLFLIILSTLPFYCAGFLLWGTAGTIVNGMQTPVVTNTPLGGQAIPTSLPTVTPLNLTITAFVPLQPTPLQFIPGFNPGGSVPTAYIQPTNFIQPTIFIPPATLAPTLTPFPTNPPPATFTPVPLPTDPPLPTNTPVPLPTEAPPATEAVLPP